ncbi:hypothetical protein LCGC14_1414530 [marine sediment metagenome]|uniref:Uncharacterized protein n=1 Tax=marine sediment metagenome TaxID=412755 RepID=A0A0F9JT91_9ZZZZ
MDAREALDNKVVTIEVIKSQVGRGLYINSYRVAGTKPYGGGTVEQDWHPIIKHILTAIPELKDTLDRLDELEEFKELAGKLSDINANLYDRLLTANKWTLQQTKDLTTERRKVRLVRSLWIQSDICPPEVKCNGTKDDGADCTKCLDDWLAAEIEVADGSFPCPSGCGRTWHKGDTGCSCGASMTTETQGGTDG